MVEECEKVKESSLVTCAQEQLNSLSRVKGRSYDQLLLINQRVVDRYHEVEVEGGCVLKIWSRE